jgi:hypothetical protein
MRHRHSHESDIPVWSASSLGRIGVDLHSRNHQQTLATACRLSARRFSSSAHIHNNRQGTLNVALGQYSALDFNDLFFQQEQQRRPNQDRKKPYPCWTVTMCPTCRTYSLMNWVRCSRLSFKIEYCGSDNCIPLSPPSMGLDMVIGSH